MKLLRRLLFWAMALFLLPLPASADHCGEGEVHVGFSLPGQDKCVGEGGRNPIFEYLGGAVRLLEGVIGVAIVLAIVVSGIQYIISAGNPDAVKSAKQRLSNAILGLVLYLLMFGIFEILGLGNVLS